MNPTLEAILKAVSYHDLFDMALAPQEIALAMPGRPVSVEEVLDAVASSDLLATDGGFVMLAGREALATKRQARYALAEDKFRRALRFFRFARFVPFLRATYVCNTLAKSNAREESDIDIFAVSAPGRIWTCRLLVGGLATLMGMRREGEHVSDHLCLSFYAAEDALDFQPLAIEDDIYLAHWLHELYPLYDEAGVTARLMRENAWAKAMRPASLAPAPARRRTLEPKGNGLKAAFEFLIGGRLERFARKFQMRSIEKKWKHQAKRSTGVVVSDGILKFHENDRRAEFRDKYRALTQRLHAQHSVRQPA